MLILLSVAHAADWPTGADPAPWTTTPSGIELQDTVVGTGAEAVPYGKAIVNYIGMLADGSVFDANRERGATFSFRIGAHDVIAGWEEGVVGMRVGGTRRLVIPASLGYGDRAVGPIPPNSVLYFEVELVDVEPPRTPPPAPSPVPDGAWYTLASGVQCADLVVGTSGRPRSNGRVCIDYVAWKDGQPVEQTYSRAGCTWIRLDDGNLPVELEEGLARMRAGGTRQVIVSDGTVYQVELRAVGK